MFASYPCWGEVLLMKVNANPVGNKILLLLFKKSMLTDKA
jgi:hypothetical protein